MKSKKKERKTQNKRSRTRKMRNMTKLTQGQNRKFLFLLQPLEVKKKNLMNTRKKAKIIKLNFY